MTQNDRRIIPLEKVETDEGEIVYTTTARSVSRPPAPWKRWALQTFGVLVGVALFVVAVLFFVYILLPAVILLSLWFFIRGFFIRRS